MYLYTPIDGRSVAVGEFIISSTGMAFEEPVVCLEEVIGKILKRSSEEWSTPLTTKTAPIQKPQPEIMPEVSSEPIIEK